MREFFRKFIVSLLSGVVISTSSVVPAFAQVSAASDGASSVPSTTPVVTKTQTSDAAKTQTQEERMENLRSRANAEIARRITALQQVITIVNRFKRLTDAQKTDLTTQIQSQIDSLTALKTKIAADTTLPTLRTDVQSIISSYRIFALFIPKVHIIASAEKISDVAVEMASLQAKLQTKIQEASGKGQDVTVYQTALTEMTEKITDAKTQATNAENLVAPLTPAGYPGNRATMQKARVMLDAARQDLAAARQSAATIISGLKKASTNPAPNS